MSKRTLRRAAERKARKAERTLQLAAQAAVATAAPANLFTFETAIDQTLEFDETAQPVIENKTEDQPQAAVPEVKPAAPAIKTTSGPNPRDFGLTGRFMLLADESPVEYESLVQSVYAEVQPQTDTECRLANSLIQHSWFMQRALLFQERILGEAGHDATDASSKKLNLFLRYQSTHERSYYRAQRELQNLQKQRRKNEIGFESQNRQQEAHQARVRLTHARAQNLEIDTACRQVMEAPMPGNQKISFEELTHACSTAIAAIGLKKLQSAA